MDKVQVEVLAPITMRMDKLTVALDKAVVEDHLAARADKV